MENLAAALTRYFCLLPVFAHSCFSSAPAESGTAEQRHSPGFLRLLRFSTFTSRQRSRLRLFLSFFSCPPLLSFAFLCYQSSLCESIVTGCDAWNNVLTLLFGLVSDGARRRWGLSLQTHLLPCFGPFYPSPSLPARFYYLFIYLVFISWTDFKCFFLSVGVGAPTLCSPASICIAAAAAA